MLRFWLSFAITISVVARQGAVANEDSQEDRSDPQSVADPDDPPQMAGARVEIYKAIGDTELRAYIFQPKQHEGNESRPAIVFFFGGGWRGGTPKQFEPHCRYLASRGMVAITADYRVLRRHGTKAHVCVTDGKSAIRWMRRNARRLGIDPNRIVAAGGSAGGHVAACAGVLTGFEQPNEDTSISSRPDAMALFNPVVVLSSVDGEKTITPERFAELEKRLGVAPHELSPFHQLKPGLPPTILFHGKGDTTVPYRSVEIFAEKVKQNDDLIQLEGYEGQGHGFFNAGRNENKYFVETMKSLDKFLVDIGFLEGPTPNSVKEDLIRAIP